MSFVFFSHLACIGIVVRHNFCLLLSAVIINMWSLALLWFCILHENTWSSSLYHHSLLNFEALAKKKQNTLTAKFVFNQLFSEQSAWMWTDPFRRPQTEKEASEENGESKSRGGGRGGGGGGGDGGEVVEEEAGARGRGIGWLGHENCGWGQLGVVEPG